MHLYTKVDTIENYEDALSSLCHSMAESMPIKPDCEFITKHGELYEILKTKGKGGMVGSNMWPSIHCFPVLDRDKESKMALCSLRKPTDVSCMLFRSMTKKFLSGLPERELYVPNMEACQSLSSAFYSDGHIKRRDYEKPDVSWDSSWDYQTFWTSPMTKREVWLPPKAYKTISLWWHEIGQQIIEDLPDVVGNDSFIATFKSTMKRMRPCRKIDLKGFGLQYPRDFLIILMEELSIRYSHDNMDIMTEAAREIFDKLCIKMPSGQYMTPERGVGLGYFGSLMTLGVRIILQECYIVKMFSDDILVDDNHYNKAIDALTGVGLIINEKKSGRYYKEQPYLMQALFTKRGPVLLQANNADIASCVRKREHYQRKLAFLNGNIPRKWCLRYYYQLFFGYEYRRGECYDHPTMLGINPHATELKGWVKGGLLRKVLAPSYPDVTEYRVFSAAYPFESLKDKRFLHYRKKVIADNRRWYTGVDEYLNPDTCKARWLNDKPGIRPTGIMPVWYDMRILFKYGWTTGKALRGLTKDEACNYIARYSLFRDPMGTGISGGGMITSTPHRVPSVAGFLGELYYRIRDCTIFPPDHTRKVESSPKLQYEPGGEGLEVLLGMLKDSYADAFQHAISQTQDACIKYLEQSLPTDLVDREEEEVLIDESCLDEYIEYDELDLKDLE